MTKRTRAQVLADADAFQRKLALIESRARVAVSVAFLEETAARRYDTDHCEHHEAEGRCDLIPREQLVVEAGPGAHYYGDEWLLHSTRIIWWAPTGHPGSRCLDRHVQGYSYWEIEDSYGQPAPREPAFKQRPIVFDDTPPDPAFVDAFATDSADLIRGWLNTEEMT